jgi:predicted DNA-binding transcriptional regulator AlpA
MTQDTKQSRAPRSPRSAPAAHAAVLNVNEAAHYCGMRTTSFWQARRSPGFPAPVLLTERLKGYRRTDLDRWLESRRARRAA